jgi:binding-protein-dependent transport system inner membrane component
MGENFEKQYIFKLLLLQGVLLTASVPRVLPWATSFWAFSPFLNHLQCSILKKSHNIRQMVLSIVTLLSRYTNLFYSMLSSIDFNT